MKELIELYKNADTPFEKVNLWFHIKKKVQEKAVDVNPDEYSGSLYYSEDDQLILSSEREGYKRGYLQAIQDLIF